MVRPIYLYGADVLRTKAEEVDLSQREEILSLIQDLKDTLEVADGCGLAAPQIGVNKRVLIVDGDGLTEVYPYLKGFRRCIVNPRVISLSETMCDFSEGCLSIPGIYAEVSRPDAIELEYWDENLEKKREVFDQFGARIVQHELSHLDGELFTDLLPPIRRRMLGRKLQNISKGMVNTDYKSKLK